MIGALIAIGFKTGTEPLENAENDRRTREPVVQSVKRFSELFGSTRCYEIQEATVGRPCDDPHHEEKWLAANGPIACGEAVRIAADLILGEDDPH